MSNRLEITPTTRIASEKGTLVLFAVKGPELGGTAQSVWNEIGLDFERLTKAAMFGGKPGEVLDLVAPGQSAWSRLLLVGAPEVAEDGSDSLRKWSEAGGAVLGRLAAHKAEHATIVLEDALVEPKAAAMFAAGMQLRQYRFHKHKTGNEEDAAKAPAATLVVSEPDAVENHLVGCLAVASGTILARDLANEAPNHLGPVEFAERIREMSEIGLEIEILSAGELEKLGMGALLAVAQGSSRPAQLAVIQWKGSQKDDAPIAFVGKGVVFDTGGISIKPAANMENMKGDMGGAAAVVGLMHALAERKAKLNAVGVVGLVENMPDGNSYRPGDILKTMSGQTIEVVNTDAEGRLVLADALWYTQDRFKPRLMIDLATLTGAIMVALGGEYAGLFSTDEQLAEQLCQAGTSTGEKLWRMPLDPGYDKLIESRFADMKNSGGRLAGGSTAAMLLKRFVNDVPWAHIDIAGTALSAQPSDTNTSWAPGFGVAVLDAFLRANHEDA